MALTTILPATVLTENVFHGSTTNFKGISQGVIDVQFPTQMGVPVSPICVFKLVPIVEVGQSVSPDFNFGVGTAGGSAPLRTTVSGTAPNISSIPYRFNGEDGVLLDCERCLEIGTSAVSSQAFSVRVKGYDFRGVAIDWTSQTYAVGALNSPITLNIPISFVTSVVFSANPLINAEGVMEINAADTFGLPYYLPNPSYVISSYWNNQLLSASANSSIDYGYDWRRVAAGSTYISARGRVDVGDTAPTNSNMLVVTYYVYGNDFELNNEIVMKNQSSLKIVGVQKNATSEYPTADNPLSKPIFVYPYLVQQDITGVQINPNVALAGGDSAFLVHYDELIAE